MDTYVAVATVLALVVLLGSVVEDVEHVGLAGAKTKPARSSVEIFCADHCRVEALCPSTGTTNADRDCPLLRYGASELYVLEYGSRRVPQA